MNKEEFVSVMSGVQSSDETLERIMNMTTPKKHFRVRKSLVVVLAIIMILALGGVSANAATDGAVAEYISNTVKVLVNGKETDSEITTDENGSKHIKINGDLQTNGENEIVIKNDKDGTEQIVHYEIQSNDKETAWSLDGDTYVVANNFQEPTTVAQK